MVGAASALTGRGWRPFAGPVAFLLVATIAIGLVRSQFGGHAAPARSTAQTAARTKTGHTKPVHRAAHKLYVVHAGDTIAAIAARNGTTTARVLKLNPAVSPTALFIGEKLRLR